MGVEFALIKFTCAIPMFNAVDGSNTQDYPVSIVNDTSESNFILGSLTLKPTAILPVVSANLYLLASTIAISYPHPIIKVQIVYPHRVDLFQK